MTPVAHVDYIIFELRCYFLIWLRSDALVMTPVGHLGLQVIDRATPVVVCHSGPMRTLPARRCFVLGSLFAGLVAPAGGIAPSPGHLETCDGARGGGGGGGRGQASGARVVANPMVLDVSCICSRARAVRYPAGLAAGSPFRVPVGPHRQRWSRPTWAP